MIARETISQILDAAHVEEIVGDFVNLKKKGAHYSGLCPFHNEKTPSFVVSPSKNIYKCFGCGKAGGPVNFVMEHEKFTYVEALRYLARYYNIPIVEKELDQKDIEAQQSKDALFVITEFAQKYFHQNLTDDEEGKMIGASYFQERGFDKKTIEKFQLGWAKSTSNAFVQNAMQNGYQLELLKKVGLVSANAVQPTDFFRERVIYPIHNLTGKVVAFAGRIIKKNDKAPKYINSPETDIYNKSQVLYGMYLAKNAIAKIDECYLVEGYMDVISLFQHGIENVVASSGTSLTIEQVRLIKRYTRNITILYDGDKAGIKAANRGLEMILEEDMNVKIVLFQANEDPDSLIQKEGTQFFQDYISKKAQDFILFKTQLHLEEAKNDPVKKASLVSEIVDTISKVPDNIKRSIFIQQCSEMLGVSESILVNETNKRRRTIYKKQQDAQEKHASNSADFDIYLDKNQIDIQEKQLDRIDPLIKIEKDILKLVIENGHRMLADESTVFAHVLEYVEGQEFTDKRVEQIFEFVKKSYLEEHVIPEISYLVNNPDTTISDTVVDIFTDPYELSENWFNRYEIVVISPMENYKQELTGLLNHYQIRKIDVEILKNQMLLKEVQDEEEQKKLILTAMHLQELKKYLADQIKNVTM